MTARANGKTASKTAKRERPALVPQPNGKGALYAGGVPGNRGNRHAMGPPASAIRERCRGSFAERVDVLTAIADGEPLQRIDVPLLAILKHATCPRCDGQLKAKDAATLAIVSVAGRVSASPKDRTHAVDILGKYGLDARTQMGVDEVKERLKATLAVIREELGPEVSERVIERIRGHWAA